MEMVTEVFCLHDGGKCSVQSHLVTSDLRWMQEPLVEVLSVVTFWGWVVCQTYE